MTNAELIKALRCEMYGDDECVNSECKYWSELGCKNGIANRDAADALEAADKRIDVVEEERDLERFAAKNYLDKIDELEAQMPKEGEWLRTDAFPHRVYCSCCYKTYVPNENWQIWQDDADNFGLPRNYCPNCGAKMEVERR